MATMSVLTCPNCGAEVPLPPGGSDNATDTCPRCGHRFPIDDTRATPDTED